MKKTFLVCMGLIVLLAGGCSGDSIATGSTPGPVDYTSSKSWLVMPTLVNVSKVTPLNSGMSNLEDSARVDVFYIHPTVCQKTNVVNCELDDATDSAKFFLLEQATAFNAVGRIYAPKYRQMALYLYDAGDSPTLQSGLTFAYEDVRSAFRYYVQNHNNGRPFIIASHSQGSDHARRLIMEEVQGTILQSRFVAAWTPGQPTPYSWFAQDLPTIPPCTAPDQTGCIAVWQSFGQGFTEIAAWNASDVYWDGKKQRWIFPTTETLYNVNPLTWTTGPEAVASSQNLGSLPVGVAKTNLTGLYPGVVGAQNLNGYLSVGPVPLPTDLYAPITTRNPLIFHSYDYALFWLNIRNNARLRVQTYLQQVQQVKYPLITSANMAAATVGTPFSYQIVTVNGATSYSVKGLPAGLILNPTTGVIAGTPTAAGTFAVVLRAANSVDSSEAELAITVNP